MQAGSFDPAAGTGRKTSSRRRRMKGRIETRASIGSGTRTRTGALIRDWAKPVAGSKGLTSRCFRMPRSDRACRSGNKLFQGFKTAKADPPRIVSSGHIFVHPRLQRRKLETSQNKMESTTLTTRQVTIGK